jgi:excisionase family DNA binding protein
VPAKSACAAAALPSAACCKPTKAQTVALDQPGNQEFVLERETGFEPATLSLGKRPGVLVPDSTASQTVANPHDSRFGELHSVSPLARFRSPFAAPVLHDFLTVRQVAARLKVSTATVYKLCARAELAHVRVLGTIRIAPDALAAFSSR